MSSIPSAANATPTVQHDRASGRLRRWPDQLPAAGGRLATTPCGFTGRRRRSSTDRGHSPTSSRLTDRKDQKHATPSFLPSPSAHPHQPSPRRSRYKTSCAPRSDTMFRVTMQTNGTGVGQIAHERQVASADRPQPIIRANQDTLYSVAIIDLSAPVTVTLPEGDGRFQSVLVISQDHYNFAHAAPGSYRTDRGRGRDSLRDAPVPHLHRRGRSGRCRARPCHAGRHCHRRRRNRPLRGAGLGPGKPCRRAAGDQRPRRGRRLRCQHRLRSSRRGGSSGAPDRAGRLGGATGRDGRRLPRRRRHE
jgi:hypothetical protein